MKWLKNISEEDLIKYLKTYYGEFDNEFGFKPCINQEISNRTNYKVRYFDKNDFGDIEFDYEAYVTDFGVYKESQYHGLKLDVFYTEACFAFIKLAIKNLTDADKKQYLDEYLKIYNEQREDIVDEKSILAKINYTQSLINAKETLKKDLQEIKGLDKITSEFSYEIKNLSKNTFQDEETY